ncbi:MAG TPA: hypothetical protein VF544_16890 [Pyrinomonadaceae bacterium]
MTINKVLMHFRQNSARRERATEDGEAPEPRVNYTRAPRPTPLLDRLALERAIA